MEKNGTLLDEVIFKDISEKISSKEIKTLGDLKKELEHDEGELITDTSRVSELFEQRKTVSSIICEYKKNIEEGKIKTGFDQLDNHFCFSVGDFNVIQSMSNHGKTSFMANLALNFLKKNDNADVLFITYESSELRIGVKLLNILAKSKGKDLILKYDTSEGYTFKQDEDTEKTYDNFVNDDRIKIFYGIDLSKLETLIAFYNIKRQKKTLIVFLDYLQIIPFETKSENWQKIKELAYKLESMAIGKKIILFAGSQVNAEGEAREGRDIYNAATNVLNIFNHSHDKLKSKEDKRYKERINGKSVMSLTLEKSKNFESKHLKHGFLFDGFCFEEKEISYAEEQENTKDSDNFNPEDYR